MDSDNFAGFLPMNLFDEPATPSAKTDVNPVYRDSQTTRCSIGSIDSSFKMMSIQNKCKSSQGLTDEDIIKRQFQTFSRKKMTDDALPRGQMHLPYSGQNFNYYSQQQPMMQMQSMSTMTMMNPMMPRYMCMPSNRIAQSTKTASFNYINENQKIRTNKRFPTWHSQNNLLQMQAMMNSQMQAKLQAQANYQLQAQAQAQVQLNLQLQFQQQQQQQQQHNQQHLMKNDYEESIADMPLKQIIEKNTPNGFIAMIKTCKGSKIIQKKIKKIQGNDIDLILSTLTTNLKEVMCDYYGNYFLQKFIECCNSQQRIQIYHYIKDDFDIIAKDICGTHSIQSLIILRNTKEEEIILKEFLENSLLELSLNENSTHIIQKVIFSIPETRREYLNNFIISNLIDLSLHPNGICIVKAFIANNQSEDLSKMLVTVFELDTTKLTCDQYGNFGIQEAIKKLGFDSCYKIIKKIKEKIVYFSSMKFSSNVIDFLISYTKVHNNEVFEEITQNLFFNLSTFNEMTKNKYGNFVLENAILLLDKDTLIKLKDFMTFNGTLSIAKEKEKKIYKLIRNVNK